MVVSAQVFVIHHPVVWLKYLNQIQDYNDDDVIDTADDLLIEPADDFGFTETSTFFGDGKDFAPNRGVDI